jgi:hypothetical protein
VPPAIHIPTAPVPLNWLDPQPGIVRPMFPVGPPADFGGAIIPNPDGIRPLPDTEAPGAQLSGAKFSTDNFNGKTPIKTVSTAAVTPDQDKLSGDDLAALTEAYRHMRDSGDARAPKVAAYIRNVVQTGNHGPMNPANPDHAGFLKTAWGLIGGLAKAAPAMFETPGINPGTGELTTGAAGRSQQNVAAAAQADAERKARGESVPYRAVATAATLATPTNVPAMEQAAREGDIGAVAAHAVVPAAVTAAPLAAEGLGRGMSAAADVSKAKAQAILDAGRSSEALQKTVASAKVLGASAEELPGVGSVIKAGRKLSDLRGIWRPLDATSENVPFAGEETPPATQSAAPAKTQPTVTPKQVEQQLTQSLGGQPLQKNVPLRQQLPAAQKATAATAATKLPDGFTAVESSALRGYRYDPAAREFESITTDGRRYVHGDVSPEEAAAFEAADSKGKAWSQLKSQNPLVAKVVSGKRVAVVKPQATTPTTVEAPGGVIQNSGDLTAALQESVKRAKAKTLRDLQ